MSHEADTMRRLDELASGFHSRFARPLGAVTLDGHRLKAYALEAPGRQLSDERLHIFNESISSAVLQHADTDAGTCGLGVVILHAGGDGDYLLVQTWSTAWMTQLTILQSPVDRPELMIAAPPLLGPCVWEARLIAHERRAFSERVLAGHGPMSTRLQAWENDSLPAGLIE